ncbi:Protein of unknown function [Gryllus bimaculatus]|nr:Protein of unknown function [Gryllus bimaculatus]
MPLALCISRTSLTWLVSKHYHKKERKLRISPAPPPTHHAGGPRPPRPLAPSPEPPLPAQSDAAAPPPGLVDWPGGRGRL